MSYHLQAVSLSTGLLAACSERKKGMAHLGQLRARAGVACPPYCCVICRCHGQDPGQGGDGAVSADGQRHHPVLRLMLDTQEISGRLVRSKHDPARGVVVRLGNARFATSFHETAPVPTRLIGRMFACYSQSRGIPFRIDLLDKFLHDKVLPRLRICAWRSEKPRDKPSVQGNQAMPLPATGPRNGRPRAYETFPRMRRSIYCVAWRQWWKAGPEHSICSGHSLRKPQNV